MTLKKQVQELKRKPISQEIQIRLDSFISFRNKQARSWFSELCFCLLTSNSKAITAMHIQKELGTKGFCGYCYSDIRDTIKRNKHRFHNTKARYIVDARCNLDIKDTIQGIVQEDGVYSAREWLVHHVTGLGYKEASHFLRNVGYDGIAILDRHIISLFFEEGIIKEKPKSLSKKTYHSIEKRFLKLADELEMGAAELDMYLWYIKTAKVLK